MGKAHLHFRSPSLLLLLLLLLQHVLAAAAARHLGSCSSHHSLPSFSPSLPPPLHAPLSRSFPISSHPQSHPFSHSAIPERMGMLPAGLHRAALLCKASSSPALLVICDPPQQPTANT